MKLGTENKKKTIFASALLVVSLGVAAWQFWPAAAPAEPAAAPAAATASEALQPASQLIRRPSGNERHHVAASLAPSLDPRLRLDMLKGSEDLSYEGAGNNIFEEHATDAIPTPAGSGLINKPGPGGEKGTGTDTARGPWTPKEIPPPPINLKFYGWASAPGEPKAIFLSQGTAVYIAHEGDVIARRYRVGKITSTEVEIEDVLSNNKEWIKLTHDNT